ncbi:MAG: hypothetical protein IKV72_01720, partial [Firmicutes bacterium]|nr:hypothetical protein [Bacillota bacterium]
REERFLEYFTFLSGERILDRIGKIINRTPTEYKAGADQVLRVVCTLPDDPESFTAYDGLRDFKSDGNFGQTIRLLTNSVIKNIIC